MTGEAKIKLNREKDLIQIRQILPLKIKIINEGRQKILTLVEKMQSFGKRKIKQIFSLMKDGVIDSNILKKEIKHKNSKNKNL